MRDMTRTKASWLALGASLALSGCPSNTTPPIYDDAGPDTGSAMPDAPPVVDTGVDAPPLADVGPVDGGPLPDAPVATCPDPSARDTVTVSGEITADTTWTCDHDYLLAAGPVFVTSGAVLTVEPGVVVRGQVRDGTRTCVGGAMAGAACTDDAGCPGSTCGAPAELGTALVITRGSRIVANGTASAPIVFTSERFGTATPPAAGNWGGLVLLGAAPTNNSPPDGALIEGLPPDGRGTFGGSDPAHDCGDLSYVRVEYAGFVFGRNNELNGITIGGCGTGTDIHHVQVHRGLDDGIEVFGGTLNLHHAIVTGTGDDSLDWDLGWTGNVQFFIAQQRNVPGEERCIEGDSHPSVFGATPRTSPTVYNFTCIGAGRAPGVTPTLRASLAHDSVILRRGSAGIIRNSIFYASPDRGIQLDDQESGGAPPADSDTVGLYVTGTTRIENNILFDIGDTGTEAVFTSDPYRMGGATINDGASIVAMLLASNRNVDPMWAGDPNDLTAPNFAPAASVAGTMTAAVPTTPAGFWQDVSYAGAVDPASTPATVWYAGWARFTD